MKVPLFRLLHRSGDAKGQHSHSQNCQNESEHVTEVQVHPDTENVEDEKNELSGVLLGCFVETLEFIHEIDVLWR